MAAFRKGTLGLLLAFVVWSCQLRDCVGETLVLDLDSEYANEWVHVDCIYQHDYNEFWTYGCEVELEGDDDVFPDQQGFWTPCRKQFCDLVFFARQAPQAKSITLDFYSKGNSPQIIVTSKYSPLDPEFSNEIGVISAEAATGWHAKTVDLSDQTRALVLNFTLHSVGSDLLLLNKITLDFGEGNLPTVPPPATTSNPVEDELITLDTENDEWLVWNGDCMYTDDFYYNYAFGCPVNTENAPDGSSGVGFWTACLTKTCRLQFVANISTTSKVPNLLSLDSYLEGDAKIVISTENGVVVEITENDWATTDDVPLGFADSVENFVINIDLDKGENGVILLDRTTLHLVPAGSASTTPPGSDGTSTTPEEGTSTTPEEGTSTTPEEGTSTTPEEGTSTTPTTPEEGTPTTPGGGSRTVTQLKSMPFVLLQVLALFTYVMQV